MVVFFVGLVLFSDFRSRKAARFRPKSARSNRYRRADVCYCFTKPLLVFRSTVVVRLGLVQDIAPTVQDREFVVRVVVQPIDYPPVVRAVAVGRESRLEF